jgi:phage/plasmid-like protein (TIGR03299 family)
MAHNISFAGGAANMAYNTRRGMPWHNLGTGVEGLMTSIECLDKAKLRFTVAKGNALTQEHKPIPNTQYIYRTDNNIVLTTDGKLVTTQYAPFQNEEAFDFVDSLLTNTNAVYETAGALGNGEIVFLTAKADKFSIGKDEHQEYIFVALYHNGSGSIKIGLTDVRIVCHNTLRSALSGKNSVSIVHKGDIESKMYEAAFKLSILTEEAIRKREVYNRMYKLQFTDDMFKEMIGNLFMTPAERTLYIRNNYSFTNIAEISTRKKNIMTEVTKSYYRGIGQADIIGTAWGAFNGITNYVQNIRNYSDSESAFKNIIVGTDTLTERAFELLTQ